MSVLSVLSALVLKHKKMDSYSYTFCRIFIVICLVAALIFY